MNEITSADKKKLAAFMNIASEGALCAQDTLCGLSNSVATFQLQILPYLKEGTRAGIMEDFLKGVSLAIDGASTMNSAVIGALLDQYDRDLAEKFMKSYKKTNRVAELKSRIKCSEESIARTTKRLSELKKELNDLETTNIQNTKKGSKK